MFALLIYSEDALLKLEDFCEAEESVEDYFLIPLSFFLTFPQDFLKRIRPEKGEETLSSKIPQGKW